MINPIFQFISAIKTIGKRVKNLTFSKQTSQNRESREFSTSPNRDTRPIIDSFSCPYCSSQNFVRRGFRVKTREKVQLYLCRNCRKTFTPHTVKGKHYPLAAMFDAVSIYNLGYNLEQTCQIMNKRNSDSAFGLQPSTLSAWISEFADYCRFFRMREFALKKYSPREMVIMATLAHQQLYRYRFHRGKCDLTILEEYQHRKFLPLKDFLEMVPVECPHQFFQKGLRASEAPFTFSKKQMIVRAKQNYATKTASFVMQAVNERKNRHEVLEKFMLANDSVTVATEVPVYITSDDIEHMKTQLGFQIYIKNQKSKTSNNPSHELMPNLPEVTNESLPKAESNNDEADIVDIAGLPKLITGHIDILQIRNGQIHILDYKPHAEKERPIEQLTLYAMALSRLTGLRLFEFKCAWFDEKDYFEFYPLHVLHKPKKGSRRRKITTTEGIYSVNKNSDRIERVRPVILSS